MTLALTRAVSPALADCELTHLEREPVDPERAARQHAQYIAAFERHGIQVITAEPAPQQADAVFVEDCAVVVDEVAVICRPGAPSRRGEVDGVRAALSPYRELHLMAAPGTLDGGDVLRVGRTVFVGLGTRTNEAGCAFLRELLLPYGYEVRGLELGDALHLKTAVTAVRDDTLVLNPRWIDVTAFAAYDQIEVDPGEPFAGNALRLPTGVLVAEHHPRTAERIAQRGIDVDTVAADELAKVEGGLTCCSILFEESSTDG